MEHFLLWLGANAVKGSIVTVIVFFALLFFSRKIPPCYRYKLWYLVAIRFVMLPVFLASFSFFTLTSSLMPEKINIEQETEFNTEQKANIYPASSISNYSKPEKSWSVLIEENISVILFALWTIGAFGLILLFILRNIWGHSLTKELAPVEDKKINAFIDECRKLANINRKFVLHETELTGSPVLLGVFKPKLLIPKNLVNKLKVKELRYVILHELMHLKKHDILINWLFGIVCALQWFNPFVWYAFARMKSDREEARDANVLALLSKNELKEYGGLILKLSTLCSSGANFSESVGIMEKNKKIKRRIRMIKNFSIMSRWNTLLAVTLLAGIGIFCLSEAKAKETLKKETNASEKETNKSVDNVQVLIKQLNDKDPKVRVRAVQALGNLKDNRAIEPLAKLLEDENSSVRGAAAFALARLGDKRAFEVAIKLLKDKNKNARREAVYALSILNDKRAIGPLAKLLKDEDSFVRVNAASALARLGDKRAFEAAIKLLKDKNKNARRQAVSALITLNDKRAIEPLAKLLEDENSSVRGAAAFALARLGDKRAFEAAIKLLKDKNKNARREAVSTLGNLNDKRAIEPLAKLLEDEDSSVRASTVSALARLGDKRAFEAAIKLLKDKNKNVRNNAVFILHTLNDKRAIEPLAKLLEDDDSSVRVSAASALARLGDKRAFEAAIKLLKDKNEHTRRRAVFVLQVLNDKRAIKPLRELLKTEKEQRIIKEIKRVLKQLNGTTPSEAKSKEVPISSKDKEIFQLIKQLNDKNMKVRKKAFARLIKLKGKRAVKSLIKLLKNKDSSVRRNVAMVLPFMRDKRAIEPLLKLLKDNDPFVRSQALLALAELGDKRSIEPALELMKDKNPLLRGYAAMTLGCFRDKRAIEPLAELLKDSDPHVRSHAITAMSRSRDKRAVEPAIELLKNKDINLRGNAANTLARLKDKRAVEPLINALKDKNSRMRLSAVWALGRLQDRRAIEPLKELLKTEKDPQVIKITKRALKKLNKAPVLEKSAVSAANSWLTLIDNGKYNESWNEAAEYFKAAISKKQWEQAIQTARKPLGKNLSRKLISKKYHTSLPGAPDGKYTVIRFKSSFENKKSAIETITPMMGKDGKWRVSGYYIK